MSYVAVLDASSFVWDKADYEVNSAPYYDLKKSLIEFINKVEAERPHILLRSELLNQMLQLFPYDLPGAFTPFKNIVLAFLGKIGSELIQYNSDDSFSATSNPNIIKAHFSEQMVQEIKYLLNEMHINNSRTPIYFTFKYLWGGNGNLKTIVADGPGKEYQTIVSDDGDELNKYFAGIKKVFVHSTKHHEGNEQGDYVSPLTCYKNKDNTIPQKHLDNSMQVGRKHYSYDTDNRVYVVFFCTGGNEYHAHDEINLNKIPAKVRIKFKKEENA